MDRLALFLAEQIVKLDPSTASRILWEAAKLYRQATSTDEREKLLEFQARVCALVGRPQIAMESEGASTQVHDGQAEHVLTN